jgi:hypothetical protein
MTFLRTKRTQKPRAAAYRVKSSRLGSCFPCSILLMVIWLIAGVQSCPASVCVNLSRSRFLRSCEISSFIDRALPVFPPADESAEAGFPAGAVIRAGKFNPSPDPGQGSILRRKGQVNLRPVFHADPDALAAEPDYPPVKRVCALQLEKFSVNGLTAAVKIKAVKAPYNGSFVASGKKAAVSRLQFRPATYFRLLNHLVRPEPPAEDVETVAVRSNGFTFPLGGRQAVKGAETDSGQVALIRHYRALNRIVVYAVAVQFPLDYQALIIREALNIGQHLCQALIREWGQGAALGGMPRKDQAADTVKFGADQSGKVYLAGFRLLVRGQHRFPPARRHYANRYFYFFHTATIAPTLYGVKPFLEKKTKKTGFF